MRLTGIHHCSIVVTDMERSRRFYRDILGLKEVERPANFTTPVVWFEVGDEHVHLIPSDRADTQSPRHFALHVERLAHILVAKLEPRITLEILHVSPAAGDEVVEANHMVAFFDKPVA